MNKSVFDHKWHRSTLWSMQNEVERMKAAFLRDHGWIERTSITGLRLWTRKVEAMLFVCNLSTAIELQHGELFDKCPMTRLSLSPYEGAADGATQPTEEESKPLGCAQHDQYGAGEPPNAK